MQVLREGRGGGGAVIWGHMGKGPGLPPEGLGVPQERMEGERQVWLESRKLGEGMSGATEECSIL